MPTFSHLHCHTQYSLLDGQASISALMKKAQADGMPAVALTDHGNMFGAFNFVAEANKYNVKPIVGCEFYLVDDRHKKAFSREKGEKDTRYHQLLLAKDQAGYHNLSKLCSLSFIEGVYSKFPRIDRELLEQYHEGLIATSCCIGAEIPQTILFRSEAEAEEKLKWWLNLFGPDYYIEIQRHGLMNFDGTGKSQEEVNQVLLGLAHKHGVKVICTNDSHYVNQDDYAAHDLLLCVNTGEEHSIPVGDIRTNYYTLMTSRGEVKYDLLDNLRRDYGRDERAQKQLRRIDEELQKPKPHTRFGFANDQFFFKTQAQMNALFADVPESVDNTNEIVDKITPPKLQRDILLPNFPLPPQFANADDFLRDLTFKGAFEGPKPRYAVRTPEVEERLNYELRIIQTMGFAGYFLITQDFINHGRSVGVAVGPGRGSAAGSAVAYCVGITNIDPIKYSLLFERFLNPERVSMPDIDIDFDDVNRQKVIDYVVNKYGKTQVAQIITFGTMAAKSAIKDVARALELALPQTNDLTKMVSDKPGTTLAGAFAENQELDMIRRDEAPDNLRGQILRLATQLEGSVRNTGIHAAGVIIAPDDITKYIPVSTSKDSDLLVTQFDGKVIESAGMLKMDFLGLKTLTIIVDALRLIERNHGVKIDIDDIPLDDEKTYALYQRGDTIGTFQFESEGMRQYLKDLKPTNIEDLIAMNALYRPGPMQFIPNFINRKHGREEIEYPHDLLEPILKYSQGICVTGDTLVHDADTGARVRIDQLADRVGTFRVQGVDADLHPAVAPITRFFANGLRDVVRVHLRDGSTVSLTPDHQVLTEAGWLAIGQLAPGDFIATPRQLTVATEAEYDLDRLRTLAYLLADGSLTSGACCDFVSQSPALVAEYQRCVGSFANMTTSTLQQVRDVTRVSVKVTDKAYYHEPTTLLRWLRELGLKTQKGGLNSREKFVPEFVFGLSQPCIAHFVASLWDCDGHVGERICFYKTISPLLAHDVQTLLLRLGIRSVVYETHYRNSGDAADTTAYQISTYQLHRFDELVGRHLVEKRRPGSAPAARSATDAVCRETFVAELRQAWPGSDKALMRTHGFDRQHLLPARRARNPRISAALVAPLTTVLELPATRRHLRVRWEEIVRIEPAGQQPVYDIEVAGIHNFVGGNILLHNCIYQEQIMQAAQIMAGYSLGGADLLRRAMGKKDMKKMALEREKFTEGAKTLHGIPAKKANEVFDVMEKFAEYGFNRCLTGDAVVFDARTGRRWTMAELQAEQPADLTVHALDNDGKLRVRPVTAVFANGIRPVFEVVTRQGKRLRATANHPLRTPTGWTLLENLAPGDRIAAPRRLAVPTAATWPAHELIALAGLLSEGNTCHPSCLYFFGNQLDFVEDFAAAIGQFPDTVGRIYQRADSKRYEVCASTGRQNHANGGPRRCGAYRWAENLGLMGKKATEKCVPAAVFELCDANVTLFLGRLWAGDGFIANHTERTPFYATSSRQLADDVQALLLRLGIQSGIHAKQFKYRDTLRPGYTVRLVSTEAVERFAALIAPHCLSREAAVQTLRTHLATTQRGLTSKDTVPHRYARQLVAAERETSGLTWKQVEAQSGVCMREFIGQGSQVKQAFRRSTLAVLADFFASEPLRQAAHSDIFWDEIVSITPAGEEPTYDLTVAEDHNFVANGLLVHNSHSAAYSVVAYQTGYLKANYPAEYMAAVLTNNMGDIKKVTFFIEEARKQGVAVLGPDVNESLLKFNVNQEGKIRFGMAAVKGAGELAVESMVEEREKHGPYQDIFDFAKRVNLRTVNKKTFESLAQAGAFDDFGKHRRLYLDAPAGDQPLIEKALKVGQQHAAAKESSQQSLFGASAFGAVAAPLPKIHDMEPWSKTEQLRREKEVVGFYLSGHPLDSYKLELAAYCTCSLDLIDTHKNKEIAVAGLINNVAFKTTKTGQPFATFTLEDYETSISPALFRDDYTRFAPLINPRNYPNEQVPPMFVRLKQELRRHTQDQWDLRILAIQPLADVAEKMSKGVRVRLDLRTVTGPLLDRLQEAIEHAPGSKRLEIQFVEPHEHLAVDMFSRRFQIEPKAFIERMRELDLEMCTLI